MSIIKDGTGFSYAAKVNSSGRLFVSSRVNDRIYYESRDAGKAFIVQFELTQAVDGVVAGAGYLQYTGTDRLNIKQVTFTTEDAAMTRFGIWKNPTVSGGVVKTPVNLNFSSNNTPDALCKHDDDGTTVTITGGSSLYTFRLNGPSSHVVDLYDAVILGTADILGIRAAAASATSKIRVNIMFAESIE